VQIAATERMDKSAFLAWVQTRERQRYELVDGSVVEAPPNTLAHALITTNLAGVLEAALGRTQWQILLSFGVDTGPRTIRDPDILVDSGGNPADLTANAPAFLAEVLSPTSGTIDLGDKPGEYLRLPNLLAYLVLSQDAPKGWLWVRGNAGFPAAPTVIVGREGMVCVPPLEIELPLAEIYRNLEI
jgi:Uma2 family endonuclease